MTMHIHIIHVFLFLIKRIDSLKFEVHQCDIIYEAKYTVKKTM